MDLDVLHAFFDEIEKISSSKSRKRHNYYMRNRHKILQQQKRYRAKNKAQIAMKQKMYRKKVKMGAHRQRRRISTGHSYTYGGYR